jgi:hypothetical protein
MNNAPDGKIEEFAWGNIAESAPGHTSGDRRGGYKDFGLRKIDSWLRGVGRGRRAEPQLKRS